MKNLIYVIIFCTITITTVTAQSYQSYFLNRVKIDSLVPLGGYITALPYMRASMTEQEMVTVRDEFLFGYALFKAGKIDSAAMFLKKSLQNGYHFNEVDHFKNWESQGVFTRMESHPALKGVPEMLKNNTEAYVHHPPIDSSLRARLIDARERDQRFRKNNNYKKQKPLDERNQKFLRKIIRKHGWPTEDVVGWDGSNAAFLIAQHSDNDVEFQRQCLQFIRKVYYAGKIDQGFYAYIIDRTRINSGKPQLFGTQFEVVGEKGSEDLKLKPVEDDAHLDIRRKVLGMMPLSQYLANSKKHYFK